MRVTRSQLRQLVRECLMTENFSADTLHQKFPFIGQDSVQLLSQFIWRFAADVAKQKGDANQTQEIASDTMMSLGASLKDLVGHFVPATVKQAPAPPERRSGQGKPPASGDRRSPQNNPGQQKAAPPKTEGSGYSEWPVPSKNERR